MCEASGLAPNARRSFQAPVPAAVIDKGIATAGLMAHLVVSKYIDHQPLFRLESIMAHSGVSFPRSTQAEWVGGRRYIAHFTVRMSAAILAAFTPA